MEVRATLALCSLAGPLCSFGLRPGFLCMQASGFSAAAMQVATLTSSLDRMPPGGVSFPCQRRLPAAVKVEFTINGEAKSLIVRLPASDIDEQNPLTTEDGA